MTNEQEQQELLFKFSMFEQQIQQLQQQIDAVEKGIIELESLNLGLDEIKGSTGKEIFAPLGRRIFVKAKLVSEELTVDVGGGNLVKKSIPETKKLLEEQINKLKQVKKELENDLEEIGKEVTRIINQEQERHIHSENCECKKD